MHPFPQIPHVTAQVSVRQALIAMTQNPIGACCVIDEWNKLTGIITDGDIRRMIQHTENLHGITAGQIASVNPRKILHNCRLGDAIELMESGKSQVNVLPVVDEENHLLGIIRIHDAWGSK
jgi:arabinose-5-phosphate isomerase